MLHRRTAVSRGAHSRVNFTFRINVKASASYARLPVVFQRAARLGPSGHEERNARDKGRQRAKGGDFSSSVVIHLRGSARYRSNRFRRWIAIIKAAIVAARRSTFLADRHSKPTRMSLQNRRRRRAMERPGIAESRSVDA